MRYFLLLSITCLLSCGNNALEQGVVCKKLYTPESRYVVEKNELNYKRPLKRTVVKPESFVLVVQDSLGHLRNVYIDKESYHSTNVGDTVDVK